MKNMFVSSVRFTALCLGFFFNASVLFAQAESQCLVYSHDAAPHATTKLKTKTIASRGGRYDLSWLDKAIKSKKVLMLGENHWMTSIRDMEEEIVFYANEKSSFPVLVLESSYSSTPYYNAYINCQPGEDCDQYLEILKPVVTSRESVEMLKRLQQWNATHPDKKITIACSDVEQDLAFTLHNTIVPYFRALGDKKLFAMINKEQQFTDAIVAYMDSAVQHAPADLKVSDRPFLDKRFLQNVVENFRVRYDASSASQKQGGAAFEALFFPARQKQIIKNLTDDAIFGQLIKEHNSIFIGGASHFRIYQSGYGDEDVVNWEGWHLANEYAPTKGKVYSIKLINLSYNLPEAYMQQEYETDNLGIKYLIAGYKSCFANGKAPGYKIIDGLTEVTAAIVPSFKQNQDQPVRLQGNTEMKKLLRRSAT
ncbi:MAG: hypothetical protein LPK07_04470, partial [Hymenobacteraceae bacterium]|nr:hypothetical protein [Hymenobacteraceae bacterium]